MQFDFRKDSRQWLLLRALAEEMTLIALFGFVDETWETVVKCLKEADENDRPSELYFTHVKRKRSKMAWKKNL